MKKTLFLILILFSFHLGALDNVEGFLYDSDSVLYAPGEKYIHGGYEIDILTSPSYPYIYIREPGVRGTLATYNWAYQYWVGSPRSEFNRADFDIAGLFLKIEMTNDQLNRMAPSRQVQQSLKTRQANLPLSELPPSVQSEHINENDQQYTDTDRPQFYNPDLDYDPDYEINSSLTRLGSYTIEVQQGNNPYVFFFDKDKPDWTIAVYNYERQFWQWRMDHFDNGSLDLRRLFRKISRSRSELDRDPPDIMTHLGYLNRETEPYDYSDDETFSRFVEYMEDYGVPQFDIDSFIHSANNPAKRGALLPLLCSRYYAESEQGMRTRSVMNNTWDHADLPDAKFYTGGMEIYFQMRDARVLRKPPVGPTEYGAAAYVRKYLKNNQTIPMVFVEIYPSNGAFTGEMSGAELYEDVEAFHENLFGVNVDLSTTQITVDYSEFKGQTGVPNQTKWDRTRSILDERVHSKFGTDKLYFYYFTDKSAYYRQAGRGGAEPNRTYGAYGFNWPEETDDYLQDLGKSLGLDYHYADVNSKTYETIPNAHLSQVPCVMNPHDELHTDHFCPLCTYSIGIPPMQNGGNSNILPGTQISTHQVIANAGAKTFEGRYLKGSTGLITLYTLFSDGTSEKAGELDFGTSTVHSLDWDGDNIVLYYTSAAEENYLGRVGIDMSFLGEYNFTDLTVDMYKVFTDKIVVIYSDGSGKQALGAFDMSFNYLGELEL